MGANCFSNSLINEINLEEAKNLILIDKKCFYKSVIKDKFYLPENLEIIRSDAFANSEIDISFDKQLIY